MYLLAFNKSEGNPRCAILLCLTSSSLCLTSVWMHPLECFCCSVFGLHSVDPARSLERACCSVLQIVVDCCRLLRWVKVIFSEVHSVRVNCSMLQGITLWQVPVDPARSLERACCSVWKIVAVCCKLSQCVAYCRSALQYVADHYSVLHCVAVCCSALQLDDIHQILRTLWNLPVAVYCRLLQCVAVCCTVLQLN